MNSQEGATLVEALIPAIFGGSLFILAIIGSRELIKEAGVAFKKRASV
ncbi:hypothetical protein [Prochlorococcus sp. MIT 1341]|nr:hypothetical protein [Prochlorococcus sp. MIT 1341]